MVGGEGERQEKRFRDWQCARAIVEGNEESASSPAFLAVSERQNHTMLLFASGKDDKLAPVFVSCLGDHYPWLLMKTVCRVLFPISCSQLGARPAAATRGARRACATACCDWKRLPKGWLAALNRLGRQMWTTKRHETPFPILVPERAVALTDKLLVMYTPSCGSCTC